MACAAPDAPEPASVRMGPSCGDGMSIALPLQSLASAAAPAGEPEEDAVESECAGEDDAWSLDAGAPTTGPADAARAEGESMWLDAATVKGAREAPDRPVADVLTAESAPAEAADMSDRDAAEEDAEAAEEEEEWKPDALDPEAPESSAAPAPWSKPRPRPSPSSAPPVTAEAEDGPWPPAAAAPGRVAPRRGRAGTLPVKLAPANDDVDEDMGDVGGEGGASAELPSLSRVRRLRPASVATVDGPARAEGARFEWSEPWGWGRCGTPPSGKGEMERTEMALPPPAMATPAASTPLWSREESDVDELWAGAPGMPIMTAREVAGEREVGPNAASASLSSPASEGLPAVPPEVPAIPTPAGTAPEAAMRWWWWWCECCCWCCPAWIRSARAAKSGVTHGEAPRFSQGPSSGVSPAMRGTAAGWWWCEGGCGCLPPATALAEVADEVEATKTDACGLPGART